MNTRKIFEKIKSFVFQLDKVYGKEEKALQYYNYLLQKTTPKNRKSMKKHIKVFRLFCDKNKNHILKKNEELKYGKVIYSDKVFIDVKKILKKSDHKTKQSIWKHLLCICALLSPNSEARNLLHQSMKEKNPENDFLQSILGEVESHIKPNANSNPMQLIGSLLQSNTLTNLVQGMNEGVTSGKLDMKKLLGSVQGMITTLSEKLPEKNEIKNHFAKKKQNNFTPEDLLSAQNIDTNQCNVRLPSSHNDTEESSSNNPSIQVEELEPAQNDKSIESSENETSIQLEELYPAQNDKSMESSEIEPEPNDKSIESSENETSIQLEELYPEQNDKSIESSKNETSIQVEELPSSHSDQEEESSSNNPSIQIEELEPVQDDEQTEPSKNETSIQIEELKLAQDELTKDNTET